MFIGTMTVRVSGQLMAACFGLEARFGDLRKDK